MAFDQSNERNSIAPIPPFLSPYIFLSPHLRALLRSISIPTAVSTANSNEYSLRTLASSMTEKSFRRSACSEVTMRERFRHRVVNVSSRRHRS